MIIIESKKFKKSYNKILKNKTKEKEKLNNIKDLFIKINNLHEVITSVYKNIYHIEKKKGNLKEYYTARLNEKIRLLIKPIGEYPYNEIEIEEIIFDDIDNTH